MSDEIWVVNASPLICLAKVGQLELLVAEGRKLIIPQAVVDEVLDGPENDPARAALRAGFGTRNPSPQIDFRIAQWGLGAGESAVLGLASALSATAIIDDRDARVAAKALGVSSVGTLGVVMAARKDGHIPSAAVVIRDLRAVGLRLSDSVIRDALGKAFGEAWES